MINMKFFKPIILILFFSYFISCENNEKSKKNNDLLEINLLNEKEQLNKLLNAIEIKPQKFSVLSNNKTKIKGKRGTVIHIDPKKLETFDNSRIGKTIEIELLELQDKQSLLFNNTQTVSNGNILISGGAYYINMTSKGKQLKIKEGEGIEVEFPKISNEEMSLFLGERDSLGQINWIQAENSNKIKETIVFEDNDSFYGDTTIEDITVINVNVVDGEEDLSEIQMNMYKAINIMNFGWINCDRFWYNPNPKTDLELLVNDSSFNSAVFYAVFSDIRSLIIKHYNKSNDHYTKFSDIPINSKITLIGISVKDTIPYLFIDDILTKADKKVNIKFKESTKEKIKEKIELTLLLKQFTTQK